MLISTSSSICRKTFRYFNITKIILNVFCFLFNFNFYLWILNFSYYILEIRIDFFFLSDFLSIFTNCKSFFINLRICMTHSTSVILAIVIRPASRYLFISKCFTT
eukprot:NODE_729_length_4743_cov_0.421619.p6 type:complete len:105 gc:universal NODE_729_length_4743_cov_0.421619:3904-3590(-)